MSNVATLSDSDLQLRLRDAEVIASDERRRQEALDEAAVLRQEMERRMSQARADEEYAQASATLDAYCADIRTALVDNNRDLIRAMNTVVGVLRRRRLIDQDFKNSLPYAQNLMAYQTADPMMRTENRLREEYTRRGVGPYPLASSEAEEMLQRIIAMANDLI